jgi:hypothetical protein
MGSLGAEARLAPRFGAALRAVFAAGLRGGLPAAARFGAGFRFALVPPGFFAARAFFAAMVPPGERCSHAVTSEPGCRGPGRAPQEGRRSGSSAVDGFVFDLVRGGQPVAVTSDGTSAIWADAADRSVHRVQKQRGRLPGPERRARRPLA